MTPSSGYGVYVPELGRRVSSIHRLTLDRRADLLNNVIYFTDIHMADHPTEAGSGLMHRKGRRQPSEDRGPLPDQDMLDQEATVGVHAEEASTSQPTQEARRGRLRTCVRRGNIRGR